MRPLTQENCTFQPKHSECQDKKDEANAGFSITNPLHLTTSTAYPFLCFGLILKARQPDGRCFSEESSSTLTDNDQSLIAVPPEFVWKLGNGWLVWTDEARMLRSFSSAASPEPATPPRSSWAEAPLLRFPLSRSLDLSLLVPCVSLSCEFLSVLRRTLKSSVFPRSRHGFQRE